MVLLRAVVHLITKTNLLCGEVPLGFDKMVFALGKDRNVILLNNRRVLPQLDKFEMDSIRFI